MSRKILTAGAGLGLLFLSGCLPEDIVTCLSYSPDGQLIAVVSEKKGLYVADPIGLEKKVIAPVPIERGGIAWMGDSTRIVYSSAVEGSADLFVSALDATTTRITTVPSREANPVLVGNLLLYTSTEPGHPSLTSSTLFMNGKLPRQKLPAPDSSVYFPQLSPGGGKISWLGNSHLCPQVFVASMDTGQVEQVTSETDPLSLLAAPVQWSADEGGVYFLRNQPEENRRGKSQFADDDSGMAHIYKGTDFCYKVLSNDGAERTVLRDSRGICSPLVLPTGGIVYTVQNQFFLLDGNGRPRLLDLDLQASLPVSGGENGEIAFVAAKQLLAVTTSSLERARVLSFEMEDKFLLAEEYFRSGSAGKSYDLYEELASGVQRTRDPQATRLVYIANLRRLGRNAKAMEEMEKLLKEGGFSQGNQEKYLWRMLGFSQLLDAGDYGRARTAFEKYHELTSDTITLDNPDSTLNALEILDHCTTDVIALYAQAVNARLNGDFNRTDQLFGDLLTTATEQQAVQREYLNALDGFDSEVYYFNPTQRPFEPSRFQQAEYLERFVRLVPQSDLGRDVRLDLFLLRIELGSYSRARELLKEEMLADGAESRPEGILEVFRNYLETPEPQPWINQSIPEVFLHAEVRPLLEASLQNPEDRFLVGVVAVKMSLLQNKPDLARNEADAALAEWRRIDLLDHTPELVSFYGRLLTFRAREAELRGLYGEAADAYSNVLDVLAENHVDNFEFQEEVRYRSQLLNLFITDYPDQLARLKQLEYGAGSELINPTWEREVLESTVREHVRFYQNHTSSTLRAWCAYEAGQAFAKLSRNGQARDAFLLALSPAAPEFIRRKTLLELAALDELDGDAWNAARSFVKIAAMPSSSAETRQWCSYQIARLHLSMNFKVSAARDALAVIVSTRSGTPLAIQAQELLVATSVR